MLLFFLIWYMLGLIATVILYLSDYFEGIVLHVKDIFFCLLFANLGPFMYIIVITEIPNYSKVAKFMNKEIARRNK